MSNIDIPERDIDPPCEDPRNVRIKSWWITIKWDDGRIEDLALPEAFRQAGKDIEGYLDEIEYEANCEINQEMAQKYGEPQEEY